MTSEFWHLNQKSLTIIDTAHTTAIYQPAHWVLWPISLWFSDIDLVQNFEHLFPNALKLGTKDDRVKEDDNIKIDDRVREDDLAEIDNVVVRRIGDWDDGSGLALEEEIHKDSYDQYDQGDLVRNLIFMHLYNWLQSETHMHMNMNMSASQCLSLVTDRVWAFRNINSKTRTLGLYRGAHINT